MQTTRVDDDVVLEFLQMLKAIFPWAKTQIVAYSYM